MTKRHPPRRHIITLYSLIAVGSILALGVFLIILQHLPKSSAAQTALFSDDFSSHQLGESLTQDSKWDDESYKFRLKLKSKWYYAVNHIYHEPYIPLDYSDDPSSYLESIIAAGDPNWTDYAFRISAEPVDNYGFGLVFRYRDINNYYRVMIIRDPKAGGPVVSLDKKENGQLTNIAKTNASSSFYGDYNPGTWYRIKVLASGSNLEVFVDDKTILKGSDHTFKSGRIGLLTWEHSAAFFDDALVLKVGN